METAKYAKTLTVHVFVTYMLPVQQFLYTPRTSHHFYWVRIMILFPRTHTLFPARILKAIYNSHTGCCPLS